MQINGLSCPLGKAVIEERRFEFWELDFWTIEVEIDWFLATKRRAKNGDEDDKTNNNNRWN